MSSTLTRVAFCTRCCEDGVAPEKQFLLAGDICGTCGGKVFTPERHQLPAEVNRLLRNLVESFMFKLENVDPNYQHETPTGIIPMRRLYLSNRSLRGLTCIISWYPRPEMKESDLQAAASWDDHLNSFFPTNRPPQLVEAVGRSLNKSFRMNWWKPIGPRVTARLQTIAQEVTRHMTEKVESIWIGIELSWEQVQERRYLIKYQEHAPLDPTPWMYSNGFRCDTEPMTSPLMTMDEAVDLAMRSGAAVGDVADVYIWDAFEKKNVEHMLVTKDGRRLETTLRYKAATAS